MGWQEVSHEVIQHPKTGAVVASATTSTWLAWLLDLIPDDIAKLAAVVGIFLSCTLIYVHWLRAMKVRLEIQLLKAQAQRDQADQCEPD
jgi:hypothetical protein